MLQRIFLGWFFLTVMVVSTADAQAEDKKVHDIGEVQVSAPGDSVDVRLSPSATTLSLENLETAGTAQNITDLIVKLPMFDNRGTSTLVPDVDNLYMRGFGANRFTTAVDGMALRKTGGRKASNIVDYGLLPPWLFSEIQVLTGPHSALYPGKSIGGVLNLIPKEPEKRESPVPETHIDVNAQSYDTWLSSIYTRGSAKNVTYDLGYQEYTTDGYLRHTEADMASFFSRIGYILPSDGFITLSLSHTDTDKNTTVINDPYDPVSEYDPGYPIVTDTTFYAYQEPTWNSEADSYRLNLKQPSDWGTWTAQAYYSEEMRDYYNVTWADPADPSLGTVEGNSSFDTTWTQQGGKIQNVLTLGQNHTLTLGTDLEQCYDDGNPDKDPKKRIEVIGAYLEDRWAIVNGLTLTAGLRYEDVAIAVSNLNKNGDPYVSGQPAFIDRDWNEVIPKSFLTWDLEGLAQPLRDTSLSAGVSKIWRAPDYHGDYNPQGRPAGAFLEPEHGFGCDLVLTRRLFYDVTLKLDYGYYEIKDYIARNSDFALYTPGPGNTVTPGEEYMDYKINLEKMVSQTVEMQLGGVITPSLSFYLGYAFLDMDSKGGEPAGEKEADRRARHRVNAGFTYAPFSKTSLILDYTFQDDQIEDVSEEVAQDVWLFREVAIDSWQRVDVAIRQDLFERLGFLGRGSIKVYVQNLFDETYVNSSGYPATDRIFGTSVSLTF